MHSLEALHLGGQGGKGSHTRRQGGKEGNAGRDE